MSGCPLRGAPSRRGRAGPRPCVARIDICSDTGDREGAGVSGKEAKSTERGEEAGGPEPSPGASAAPGHGTWPVCCRDGDNRASLAAVTAGAGLRGRARALRSLFASLCLLASGPQGHRCHRVLGVQGVAALCTHVTHPGRGGPGRREGAGCYPRGFCGRTRAHAHTHAPSAHTSYVHTTPSRAPHVACAPHTTHRTQHTQPARSCTDAQPHTHTDARTD